MTRKFCAFGEGRDTPLRGRRENSHGVGLNRPWPARRAITVLALPRPLELSVTVSSLQGRARLYGIRVCWFCFVQYGSRTPTG